MEAVEALTYVLCTRYVVTAVVVATLHAKVAVLDAYGWICRTSILRIWIARFN